MIELFLLFFIVSLFSWVALVSFHRAMQLFLFALPTYLIRFSVGGIPTTLLELFFLTLLFTWGIQTIPQAITTPHQSILVCELKRLTQPMHRSVAIGMVLFLFGSILGVIGAIEFFPAVGEWRAFYVYPILLFFMIITEYREGTRTRALLIPLVCSGLLTAVFGLFQKLSGGMFVPYDFWENRATYRITGWYGFPNGIAMALAPLIPLALYLLKKQPIAWWKTLPIINTFFQSSARWTRILSGAFLFFGFVAILLSKSTGALIGLLGTAVIAVLLFKKTRILTLIFGGISLLIFFFAIPANHPIRQEIFMQDDSGQRRIDMWAETSEYLRVHPIMGTGMASYEERIKRYRVDTWIEVFHHPHNVLLTIWMNTTIIGLFGWLLIMLYILRSAAIAYYAKEPDYLFVSALMASLLILMIMGLVDSPYIKNDLALFWWAIIGLIHIHAPTHLPNTLKRLRNSK